MVFLIIAVIVFLVSMMLSINSGRISRAEEEFEKENKDELHRNV